MARVFLGVGSNEGDRAATISSGIQQLGRAPGIHIVQMAMLYESEAVGGPPQGPYLNTVVECQASLEPLPLLTLLKQIEVAHGRQPNAVRWSPRPLDLDILFYDDRIMQTERLTIPHPLLQTRHFVLEPMVQLSPTFVHPLLQRSMADLLAALRADAPAP